MELYSQVTIKIKDNLLSSCIIGQLRNIQIDLQKSLEGTIDTVLKSHGICNKAIVPVIVEHIEIENEGDYE